MSIYLVNRKIWKIGIISTIIEGLRIRKFWFTKQNYKSH
jgi:hypothetical protein